MIEKDRREIGDRKERKLYEKKGEKREGKMRDRYRAKIELEIKRMRDKESESERE